MKEYAATLIARINTDLTQPTRRDMSTATLNRRNELWAKLLTRLQGFQAKEKSIVSNRTLSDEGKTIQMAKEAEAFLSEQAWAGQVLRDMEAALARLKTILFIVESPVKDEVLREIRAREVRDRIAGLNLNERSLKYVQASEKDDAETMWALLHAPGGSWVSADIQQRADEARAQRTQPKEYETYQQATLLHDQFRSVVDHVGLMLKSYALDTKKVATGLGLAA